MRLAGLAPCSRQKIYLAGDPWTDLTCLPDENNDSERSKDTESDTTEYPSRIWTFENIPSARVTLLTVLTAFSSVFAGQFRSAKATRKGASTNGW
jgi:hypothetical protein